MAGMVKLKEEVRFSEELRWVLEVLKQVSASELKRLEKARLSSEDLIQEMRGCFGLLHWFQIDTVLTRPRPGKEGILLWTSDAGFVGDLNVRVARRGLERLREQGEAVELLTVGQQAQRILMEHGAQSTPLGAPAGPADHKGIAAIRQELVRRRLSGGMSRLQVVYPRYDSMVKQEITVRQIFPAEAAHPEDVPVQGTERPARRELLLEAPLPEIEGMLAGWWVEAFLTEAAWNAKLSELATRTLRMEGALDDLASQRQEQVLQVFRVMHEEMDQQIREIYASRLMMRQGGLG